MMPPWPHARTVAWAVVALLLLPPVVTDLVAEKAEPFEWQLNVSAAEWLHVPEHQHDHPGRLLQSSSPCPPSIANGAWSGSLPSMPDAGSGSNVLSSTTTYTLTCNSGYTTSGGNTGSCYFYVRELGYPYSAPYCAAYGNPLTGTWNLRSSSTSCAVNYYTASPSCTNSHCAPCSGSYIYTGLYGCLGGLYCCVVSFSYYFTTSASCVAVSSCSAGTYSASGNAPCTTCPTGYYCSGGTTIALCPAGTYTSSSGLTAASSCTTCPTGYYCTGGSSLATCAAGRYGATSGLGSAAACTVCPSGDYCTGGSSVSSCAAGTYTTSTGLTAQSSCTSCPVGSYCTGGTALSTCAAGTYGASGGLTSAGSCTTCGAGSYCTGGVSTSCPAGTYSTSTGLTSVSSCTTCPLTYYCTGGSAIATCAAGTYGGASGLTSAAACTQCPLGYYCTGGTKTVCAAGTYGASTALTSASSCTTCPLGSYCTGGTQTVCAAGTYGASSGLTSAASCTTCAVGSYCTGGTQTSCPAGTRGTSTGLTSVASCTQCAVGSYCTGGTAVASCPAGTYGATAGLISAAACTTCTVGSYCTGGSAITSCAAGTYGASAGLTAASSCTTCPIGSYCIGGATATDCAAGTYGASTGLTSASACTTCPAGSFCTGGSAQTACSAGSYCTSSGQTSASACSSCPTGSYCTGGSSISFCASGTYGASSGLTSSASCTQCPSTSYCTGGTAISTCAAGTYGASAGLTSSSSCTTCPLGSYCTGGVSVACAAGTYGASTGLTSAASCTTCPAGSYCTGGSLSTSCPAGTYSTATGQTSSAACTSCTIGSYCTGGTAITSCTAGTYGASAGLTGSSSCTLCPTGNYCTGGTANTVCAAGTYGASAGLTSSASCTTCPAGSYCTGGTQTVCSAGTVGSSSGATTSAACVSCTLGNYCTGGSQSVACPAGTYGASAGLTSSASCTTCPAGKYCTGGSQNVACPAGTYGTSAGLPSLASCTTCTVGYYCTGGTVLTSCPAGTYGASAGLTAASQCTTCPVGSVCTGGASAAACPAGTYGTSTGVSSTAACTTCPLGSYCTGGTSPVSCAAGTFGANMGLNASSQCTLCPLGYYCTGGSQNSSCPAGTYGTTTGLSSLAACTTCPAGSYCTGGSSISTCSSGTYSSSTGLTASSSCTTCPLGYYCTGGTQTVCAAGRYGASTGLTSASSCTTCPLGSYCTGGTQTVCAAGTYGASTGLTSASSCTTCATGSYCTGGTQASCPAGTYGASSGLTSSASCTTCPIGSYCTGGASSTVCASGTYGAAAGLTASSSCTVCPAGSYCSGGTQTLCPAGSYGSAASQSTSAACTTCTTGSYCTGGAAIAVCPIGTYGAAGGLTSSSACSTCPLTYYCTGGSLTLCPSGTYGATTGLNASSYCTTCPIGSYCVNGVQSACPPGVLGNSTGLSVSTCSNPCPAGSYCTSNVQTECPGGTYGSTTGLGTAACSGPCPAGYYCPAGAVNPTANPCGSAAVYCPSASATALNVGAGNYSTPVTAPSNLRTGQAVCPPQMACAGGVILPAVQLTPNCTNNAATASLTAGVANADFGPNFTALALGYSGNLTYSIAAVSAVDATCTVALANFTVSNYGGMVRLHVGAYPLLYTPCMNGFTVVFTANRTTNMAQGDFCAVTVSLAQVILPPVITDCGFRAVAERSIIGTNVGLPLEATTTNVGTSIFWALNYVAPNNPPLAITACGGQLSVLAPFLWITAQSYRVSLNVTNSGAALGLGTAMSTCVTYVNVTMVPIPPSPTITQLYIAEGSPAGTVVGSVDGVDPTNFTFNCSWSAVETPNAFNITPDCTVGVSQRMTISPSLKSTYAYTLAMSNPYATSYTPVTINLLPVPQPPITFPQSRTVWDNAAVGTMLYPNLTASSAQYLNLTFSLSAPGPFNITPNGTVYIASAGVLYFETQPTYSLYFTVTDTNGLTASSTLTINLLDSNKAPAFTSNGMFNFTVPEGSLAGATLTGTSWLTATDPNSGQALTFTIISSQPATGSLLFAVNGQSGVLSLAASVGMFAFDASAVYPIPRTFRLNVTVSDNGVPPLATEGTVWITVTNIAPRLTLPSPTVTLPGNVTANAVVANVSAASWTAYSRGALVYSMSAETVPPAGGPAFSLNSATGVITVANVSTNSSGTGLPPFDFNIKNSYAINVTVTDTTTGLTATAQLMVYLSFVSRPPAWLPVPMLYAAAQTTSAIGQPLMEFVTDPDLAVPGIVETFTFNITGGNVEGTFAVVPSTGQLYVADNSTQALDPTSAGAVGIFNLSVMVTSSGVLGFPPYNATTVVQIAVTAANFPPTVNYANFTLLELADVGSLVGYVTGSDRASVAQLTYTMTPAGASINRPFPFNITTVLGGPGGYGQGAVTTTGPISWNAAQTYYATVTATNDGTPPLSNTGSLQINIGWVERPPYFNAVTQLPNSTVFTLTVNALSPPGTVVGPPDGLHAFSKDPWQQAALVYFWATPTTMFDLNASTGVITVALGAPLLNFTLYRSFNLTLAVRDSWGMMDFATVNIGVLEVNVPATWVGSGLFTPSGADSGDCVVSVLENAAADTVVAYVLAQDVNINPPWAAVKYSIAPIGDALTGFFVINVGGAGYISVAPGATLNYWDQSSFTLTILETDSDLLAPIVIALNITINLIQVNTVSITGFYLDSSITADVGSNVTVITPGVLNVAFGTQGMPTQLLYIVGSGFGPTARRLALTGALPTSTPIIATFASGMYTAFGCAVVVPNTVVACGVPAGAGTGHRWAVTVAGVWTSTSTALTGYYPPTITSVTKVGSTLGLDETLATSGTDFVRITGDNLGPSTATAQLAYGRASMSGWEHGFGTAAACVYTTSHFEVVCPTTAGVGASLKWSLSVNSQQGSTFTASSVAYTPPAVLSVSAPPLATAGGQPGAICVNGTNLGPFGLSTSDLTVMYSVSFVDAFYTQFSAYNCRVVVAHTAVVCDSVAGVGTGLHVVAVVGGQASTPSSESVSYVPPVLMVLSGAGKHQALTTGGQEVVLSGTSFGPLSQLFPNGSIVPNDLQPAAVYSSAGGLHLFTAVGCRVVVPDTTISCQTAPGVGSGLAWTVVAGSQVSQALSTDTSDYHPPVVAAYNGAGATDALTSGDQSVQISGTNFGPAGTQIDSVVYGAPNGTVFEAANCTLTTPQTVITCDTVVGAGANLVWTATIGGQASVTPSTAYGAPMIVGFAGAGATAASTDGGQNVTLLGQFFSIQQFLGAVTFGPTGSSFTAQHCIVSTPHTAVTCVLPPGTGPSLFWYITVGGQVSHLSPSPTSYALPVITALTPINATTDALLGGRSQVILTIDGTDFAVNYPAAQLMIKINNRDVPRPPQPDIDAHWAALQAGGVGLDAVYSWIASLTTLYPSTKVALAPSVHRLTAILPPGFGPAAEVFVMVAGVPSNIVPFLYDPPTIVNIAPDRSNVSVGFLRVWVEGSSFCNGVDGCGSIAINNITYVPVLWGDTQVMVVAPDPGATGVAGSVVITVGGVASEPFPFDHPVPNINALVGQGNWGSMDTRGGQPFYIAGVLDVVGINASVSILIGNAVCGNRWGFVDNQRAASDPAASYTLECVTPPGVGSGLPITMEYYGSTSRQDPTFTFSYAPPSIAAAMQVFISSAEVTQLLNASVPLPDLSSTISLVTGVPTTGSLVLIEGLNFGVPELGVGTLTDAVGFTFLTLQVQNHTLLVAVVPPGDGASHGFQYSVALQSSAIFPYAYARPSVTSLSPAHGPTAGGTNITITGANFGLTPPSITIGGRNCAVVMPYVPTANHDTIVCVSPVGQGVNQAVVVTVNGQTSLPSTAMWSYDAPVVTFITPAHGATSGRALGPLLLDGVHHSVGDRIVQVVSGFNFGVHGTVSFVPSLLSDALSSNSTVPDTDVLSWNDTAVVFLMPPGYGYNLLVSVFADQPPATGANVMFDYDPPQVATTLRYNLLPEQCEPFTQCFTFDNITRCNSVPAGCYDTVGGYTLELVGTSFGPQSILFPFTDVRIGGATCASPPPELRLLLSDSSLICVVPAGVGNNLPVTVTIGSRTSTVTNTSRFSYDPPVIAVISPNTPDALGSQPINIRGKNFGGVVTPLTITVDGTPCLTAEWQNDGNLVCTPPPDVVGPKNISILVANRTQPALFYDVERMLMYECLPGYYGLQGEVCLPCPQGALCPGSELLDDRDSALAGFWRENISVSDTANAVLCDAPRRLTRETCPAFLPCGPPAACLANNECAEGYQGDRCAYCLAGQYYRSNNVCIKCPNNLYVLYAGLALLLLLVTAFAYFLNKKNISLAVLAIGVDYAQVMSMFARTNIVWPPALTQVFNILSAFNLNLDIVAPECLNPGIQYWQKWFFIEGIPIASGLVLLTVYFAKLAYKSACLNVPKARRGDHLPATVSTSLVIYRMLFLYLTRTSFDVLNCTPTTPPVFRDPPADTDAIQYMAGMVQPDYECWAAGSWQVFLFPFGLGTLLLYSLAVPVAAFWWLRKNRDAVKTDQILRAQGIGDDRLTNPRFFDFRQMWSKLYYHYLPGKWYWEIVITARKAAIAATSLAFRQVPSYQLAVALVILFAAYVVHAKHRPYMSFTTRPDVVGEHLRKALGGDALHARIESDMREAERKNTRVRARSSHMGAAALTATGKASHTYEVLMRTFESNAVEAVLLACCILVCLAGIMFDSSRFTGDNMSIPQVQHEYLGITIGCLAVLVFSFLYYATVFVLEICSALCPSALARFACCSSDGRVGGKLSRAGAHKVAGRQRRGSSTGAASGNNKMVSTGAQLANASDASGGSMDLAVNPLMLSRAAEHAHKVGSVAGVQGVLDESEITRLTEPPTPAMWHAIQDSYSTLMKLFLEDRAALRAIKADVARADDESKAQPSAYHGMAVKSRTEFRPQTTSESATVFDTPLGARAVTDAGLYSATNPLLAAGSHPLSTSQLRLGATETNTHRSITTRTPHATVGGGVATARGTAASKLRTARSMRAARSQHT